jgi:hypothetical protein
MNFMIKAESCEVAQMTRACLDVFVQMIRFEPKTDGWLFPCYETIAEWARVSRRTVHRALNTLRDLGVIDWVRRFTYTKDEILGARSEQTSNLYRFTLTDELRALISKNHPPLPDDITTAQEELTEEFAIMIATLDQTELQKALPDDPARRFELITALLKREMYQAQSSLNLEQRQECHKDTASQSISYNISGDNNDIALDGQRHWP